MSQRELDVDAAFHEVDSKGRLKIFVPKYEIVINDMMELDDLINTLQNVRQEALNELHYDSDYEDHPKELNL